MSETLEARFQAADIDGNGRIDKIEFLRLAESLGDGTEYAMFHWLETKTVDALFEKYSGEDGDSISFNAFKELSADGVLLEGRLSEYRTLFEQCPSWRQDDSGLGTVDRSCIVNLAGRLEHPFTIGEAEAALDAFCDGGVCTPEDDRLSFAAFLNLFRDRMLDLKQIEEYMQLEALPDPSFSASEVEEAQTLTPAQAKGVYLIESSEQFDALGKLHPDKEVVLLAGLSWCRPCKSLTRPMEKLAEHYHGAVFAKVLGDHSDNTKNFFKSRLNVKATPHITIHRRGTEAYMRTGTSKWRLEDAVRRFYNTATYPLPDKVLYPKSAKA